MINDIKTLFNNSSDLIIKKIKEYTVLYLESLCSSDKINEYILKDIAINNTVTMGPNTKEITKKNISTFLNNGFAIVLSKKIYAIEVKAILDRGINKPEVEISINGPKDALEENIQINLGLIKKRIRSEKLVNVDYTLGKYANTKVSILYVSGIAKKELVKDVSSKLNNINIDSIKDALVLKKILESNKNTIFPLINTSERPDVISDYLLEGKIAIIIDNSPTALIIPSFFVDYINPVTDMYMLSVNVNVLKILRMICLFITLLTPAIYISLINYNQETLPLKILINFTNQRNGVPFPASVEAIIMLIICAILKESDLRFPSSYGSATSILGALIIGEAAVAAGISSPIMIIVIAISFITSLIFNDIEFTNSLRFLRFAFLLSATFLGLYGILIAFLFFILHISSLSLFNYSYVTPLSPFDKVYLENTLIDIKTTKKTKRSKLLSNNIIKKRDHK